MLEKIIDTAYGEFLKTDSPELIGLCEKLTDEILKRENPSKNFVLDRILDVGSAYESNAYAAGFRDCVRCFRSFLIDEIVGSTSNCDKNEQ